MTESTFVFTFLDRLLGQDADLDYEGALNGVQVDRPGSIQRVGAAVDASERVIRRAIGEGVDLLLVHHGLFWDPARRVTGRRFRKLRALLSAEVGVYASHLPLDRHPEVGNSACLLRHLDLEPRAAFGSWKGIQVGWEAEAGTDLETLRRTLELVVQGPVRAISGAGSRAERVAVVTGAGAGFLREAAEAGIDTLITGEAPHHAHADAHELGVNLLLAGHYATETFGVREVAGRLEEAFGLPWIFLDDPSGL
jgi:dinuclear metal center YbgI/SA1388 family protein